MKGGQPKCYYQMKELDRTRAGCNTFAFMCHLVPQKPMHLGRLQCARSLAATGLSARAIQNKHRNHFFPVALRMRIPQQTSKYWFWRFNLAPPCRLQSVSHGKSASKLERMKHIRRTHAQFPYLMAALQMIASCIVQSFTKCRTKTSKNKSSTLIYQLCSVSPPVNFFAAHSGYDLS